MVRCLLLDRRSVSTLPGTTARPEGHQTEHDGPARRQQTAIQGRPWYSGPHGNGLTYQDLADRTVVYELGEMRVRVLELAAERGRRASTEGDTMRCRTRALLILPLALLAATNAKAADLYGKVVENELGGPPMVGIEIGAAGANPTATGSLGLFRLALPRRQPGETVSLTVHKEGYEVVNDVQLEVTLLLKPEDRPLILLLCRPKLCEEMRRRFYRLKGREIADASFQRRTRELEESNQATDTERTRLQKERDTANAAAEKLAEELARTRPTEGSDMYQKEIGRAHV